MEILYSVTRLMKNILPTAQIYFAEFSMVFLRHLVCWWMTCDVSYHYHENVIFVESFSFLCFESSRDHKQTKKSGPWNYVLILEYKASSRVYSPDDPGYIKIITRIRIPLLAQSLTCPTPCFLKLGYLIVCGGFNAFTPVQFLLLVLHCLKASSDWF